MGPSHFVISFHKLVQDVQVCRLKGSLSVLIGRSAGCVSPEMPAGTFMRC